MFSPQVMLSNMKTTKMMVTIMWCKVQYDKDDGDESKEQGKGICRNLLSPAKDV
jgi:hypothetical protein